MNTQALLSLACERGEECGGGGGVLVMQPILVHNIIIFVLECAMSDFS